MPPLFPYSSPVNQNLPVFEQMPAKGAARGWQKYLWDSPMEQTERNGEAVSSNKSSTLESQGTNF